MADGRDDAGYRWKRNKRDDGTSGFVAQPGGSGALPYGVGPSTWQGPGGTQAPYWNGSSNHLDKRRQPRENASNVSLGPVPGSSTPGMGGIDTTSRPATDAYELDNRQASRVPQGMYRASPGTVEYARGSYGNTNVWGTSAANQASGASGYPLEEITGPRYGTPQAPRASTESSASTAQGSGSARPGGRTIGQQLNGPGRGVPPSANGSHEVSSSGEIFSHHAGHDLRGQGRQQRGQPTVVYPVSFESLMLVMSVVRSPS